MREFVAIAILALTLLGFIGSALAQTSVTLPPPAPPPIPPPLVPGLGTPNPFATLANPGSTQFRPGVANPLDNPYPMLPWGDGQIGGERYGQVIRYWEQRAQVVENVILVLIEEEGSTPESPPDVRPEGGPQGQPATPPQGEPQGQPATPPQGEPTASPRQGAVVDVRVARTPQPKSVVVPASWIVETTRGYIHMPRWVLKDLGAGRYQWAVVGAWFQPR